MKIDDTCTHNGLEMAAWRIQSYGGSGGVIAVDFEVVNPKGEPKWPLLMDDFSLDVEGEPGELNPVPHLSTWDPYRLERGDYTDGTLVFEIVRGVELTDVKLIAREYDEHIATWEVEP